MILRSITAALPVVVEGAEGVTLRLLLVYLILIVTIIKVFVNKRIWRDHTIDIIVVHVVLLCGLVMSWYLVAVLAPCVAGGVQVVLLEFF